MCKIRFQHKASQDSVVKWQILYKKNDHYILSNTLCETDKDIYTLKPLDIDDLEENIPVIVIWDEYLKKENKNIVQKTVEMYKIEKSSSDTVIQGYCESNRDEFENIQIIKKEKTGYSYTMPSIALSEIRKTYKAALVQAIIPDSGLIAPLLYQIDSKTALDVFGTCDEKKIEKSCVIIRKDCGNDENP